MPATNLTAQLPMMERGLKFWIKELYYLPGAFGKYIAWSFFSVTDKQTHLCLVSF